MREVWSVQSLRTCQSIQNLFFSFIVRISVDGFGLMFLDIYLLGRTFITIRFDVQILCSESAMYYDNLTHECYC